MTLEADLISIEHELWKNDVERYAYHFDEDALLLFPETGVITRDFALDAIEDENTEGRRWAEVAFKDVRAIRVTDDTALLVYAATARWEHETETIKMLASSLYVRRQGRWRVAFHQQTQPN